MEMLRFRVFWSKTCSAQDDGGRAARAASTGIVVRASRTGGGRWDLKKSSSFIGVMGMHVIRSRSFGQATRSSPDCGFTPASVVRLVGGESQD